MSILNEFKKDKAYFFTFITISFLPIILLAGSAAINLAIIIIDVFVLYKLFVSKNFSYLNNKYFYLLIIFWIYLIINLFFSISFENSFPRSIGFIRFIIFTFAVKYFFFKNNNILTKYVLNIWTLIFFIVSIDLIYEFIYGANSLGFVSYMPGRLSGFLNQELKIGHFYSAFILICLINIYQYFFKLDDKFSIIYKLRKYIFYVLLILFLFISLIIGERSNFLKVFLMIIPFLFLIERGNNLKKILSILIAITFISITVSNIPYYKHRIWGMFLSPLLNNPIELISNSSYGKHYQVAIEIFKNNKLVGVGLRGYRLEAKNEKYDKDHSLHPHQTHFEIISELGIVGYLLFISIFFFIINNSIKYYLRNRKNLHLSGLLFVLITLVPIIPSGSFFTTFGATLFWLNFSFILPTKN